MPLQLTILLLSLLIGSSFCLDCYGYNAYENKIKMISGKTHCTAFYEVANGDGSFSGATRNPARMQAMLKEFGGKDCKMEKHRNHDDEDYIEVYTCICFSSMCNFPFTFDEFTRRGHTLAPAYSKNIDIW